MGKGKGMGMGKGKEMNYARCLICLGTLETGTLLVVIP